MGDVPKLEFGVMGKTKKAFLFFLGRTKGGVVEKRERGAGNKQRTCTPVPGLSVVQRRLSCIGGA